MADNAQLTQEKDRLSRRQAFTLIELLTVIGIIGILMGLILGVSRLAKQAALKARARADIEKIHDTLAEYNLDNGTYPDTNIPAELDILISSLPAGVDFEDPWHRNYVYIKTSDFGYTLYSHGPKEKDGAQFFTADDISSGK